MVKIGGQKTGPNTLVSAASVRGRTLADNVYFLRYHRDRACYRLFLLQFFCLEAAGSGIPEVIGFLNGTVMRHVFNLRTFVVKFISCCLGVGAGLPAGPEGPMIHIG